MNNPSMLTITLIPTVCPLLYPIKIPSSNQQKNNPQLSKERSVRPKVSPRQMLILKLGMDTITVMVDIVDTTDLLIDMVDTTDIPDTDTEDTVIITDGANRYFNLDQTNSKFRS